MQKNFQYNSWNNANVFQAVWYFLKRTHEAFISLSVKCSGFSKHILNKYHTSISKQRML